MKRGLALILSVMMVAVLVFALASCGDTHEHTFSDKWEIDENNHWHKATCEHTDAIASKGGHVDEDEDGACDMCGNGEVHMHKYTDAWTSDETGHWHMATCDGCTDVKGDVYPHTNKDGNDTCDLCGYKVAYVVTVTAPATVDAPEVVYVDRATGTATFEATAKTIYMVAIEGATQKGDAVVEDGVATYTFELANVTADSAATISAKQFVYAELVTSFSEEEVEFVPAEFGTKAAITETLTLKAGKYAIGKATDIEDIYVAVLVTKGEESFEADDTGCFVIAEDGEYTIEVSITDWSSMLEVADLSATVSYVYDTNVTVDALTGEGYVFPADVFMSVTLPLPEAGAYEFASTVEELLWEDTLGQCIKYIDEAGNITLTVNAPSEEGIYEFDWNASKVVPTATVVDGDTVTIAYGKYTIVEFTATEAGTYSFAAVNGNTEVKYFGEYETRYYLYNAAWSEIKLEANEKINLYIINSADDDYDGADTIEDTFVVTYKAPNPTFTVTTTDTYGWFDMHTFTADVSGAYTFYFPAGLGVWSEDSYDAGDWDYDIAGFGSEGAEYTVDIPAGGTFAFYYGATTRDDFVIEYEVEEKEVSGGGSTEPQGNVLQAGTNYGTASMADVQVGVEYTFNVTTTGEYAFAVENVNYILRNGTMPVPTNGTVYLEAGTIILLVYPMATGEFSVTITAPAPSTVLSAGQNSIVVSADDKEAGVKEYTFTPVATGEHRFTGDFMVTILNGTSPVAGVSGYYTLEAGVEYTVQLGLGLVSEGTSVLTIDAPAAPKILSVGNNTIVVSEEDYEAGMVDYTFTATATGEHRFSSSDLMVSSILAGTTPVAGVSGYYTLEAGVEYTVTISLNYVFAAGNYTLTIDAPAAE